LLSSNISSTCPHNMVNFGPLAAEIVSLVWGTPGNFNRFRVLAAFLHGTLVVGVSQTAALNRGRHLYSAGRPSRWALVYYQLAGCRQPTLSLHMVMTSQSNLAWKNISCRFTLEHHNSHPPICHDFAVKGVLNVLGGVVLKRY